jgi:hypothetical protein
LARQLRQSSRQKQAFGQHFIIRQYDQWHCCYCLQPVYPLLAAQTNMNLVDTRSSCLIVVRRIAKVRWRELIVAGLRDVFHYVSRDSSRRRLRIY